MYSKEINVAGWEKKVALGMTQGCKDTHGLLPNRVILGVTILRHSGGNLWHILLE
jgi:hypothetical protein